MSLRSAAIRLVTAAFVASMLTVSLISAETATVEKKDSTTTANVQQLKLQTSCPIMGNPIDKTKYVDYNGKRIYVCCGGCIAQVKSDPEGAIKKLAAMGQEPEAIPVKATKEQHKSAAKDTSMKGMNMSKDSSMKGMDHSKM